MVVSIILYIILDGMGWDALLKCADGEASTYDDYHPPVIPTICSPAIEAGIQGMKYV